VYFNILTRKKDLLESLKNLPIVCTVWRNVCREFFVGIFSRLLITVFSNMSKHISVDNPLPIRKCIRRREDSRWGCVIYFNHCYYCNTEYPIDVNRFLINTSVSKWTHLCSTTLLIGIIYLISFSRWSGDTLKKALKDSKTLVFKVQNFRDNRLENLSWSTCHFHVNTFCHWKEQVQFCSSFRTNT
jgi:hypothetical protein